MPALRTSCAGVMAPLHALFFTRPMPPKASSRLPKGTTARIPLTWGPRKKSLSAIWRRPSPACAVMMAASYGIPASRMANRGAASISPAPSAISGSVRAPPCRRDSPPQFSGTSSRSAHNLARDSSSKFAQPEQRKCHTVTMPFELPKWAIEMAWVSDHDVDLPSVVEGINVVLNRVRLAAFLTDFAEDRDVRDLLALDALGAASGLPLSSTGEPESIPLLTLRPFRIWEYAWLYKCLGLSAGGAKVLDLGGPASHLSVLSAIAGCRVTSLDINPVFVQAAKECARGLDLDLLDARVGDMRDLSVFPDDHFDIVMSSSVLEHLTANDQETALREMARDGR